MWNEQINWPDELQGGELLLGPFYVLVSTGIEIYLLDTLHLIKSEYFNMDSL